MYDVDGTGKVNLNELLDGLGVLGGTMSKEDITAIFHALDTDQSGEINGDEFIEFYCEYVRD